MSDEDSQSNGNLKRSLTELADKSAEHVLVRWLARWSMITVVPGLLSVLIAIVVYAGGQILEHIKKTGERQEQQGMTIIKMEAQMKTVTESQLPSMALILNGQLSAQADRILRVEKMVDEEFKLLKMNDAKQNERLEAVMERLYKFRQELSPPRAGTTTEQPILR